MIKIICLGKIKEQFYRDAIEEYLKRLTKYNKVEIIELPDYDGEKNIVLKKEAEVILKYIDSKSYIITLEIEGKELSSTEFSEKLNNIFLNYPNITFIIGSSYGLSDEIKEKANYKLSFSRLTFPHQLFRVMLLEQIYRSYKILNNETYHK